MRRIARFTLVSMLVLAGCGGSSHHAKAPPPFTVHGHQCSSSDFAMQCALHNQPHLKKLIAPKGVSARGVDYAWSQPSCATFRANGWTIAATYFDTYDRSKGWTPAKVAAMDACHVAKVAVWETGSNRATAGYYAGRTDGQLALAEAAWVRWQPGRPIFFAIDCDCSGASVDQYFRGVNSALKPAGRPTGAYGGYRPLTYLFGAHLISYGWQSYAWSGGAWNQSCLEQWLNSSAVDYDRAICSDYGQAPYNVKPPGPTPAQIKHWSTARDSSYRAFAKRHCVDHLARADCFTFGVQRVLYFQGKLNTAQTRPHCFGPQRQERLSTCEVARPYAARWSHGRDATERAIHRRKCTVQSCPGLYARDRYYKRHLLTTVY